MNQLLLLFVVVAADCVVATNKIEYGRIICSNIKGSTLFNPKQTVNVNKRNAMEQLKQAGQDLIPLNKPKQPCNKNCESYINEVFDEKNTYNLKERYHFLTNIAPGRQCKDFLHKDWKISSLIAIRGNWIMHMAMLDYIKTNDKKPKTMKDLVKSTAFKTMKEKYVKKIDWHQFKDEADEWAKYVDGDDDKNRFSVVIAVDKQRRLQYAQFLCEQDHAHNNNLWKSSGSPSDEFRVIYLDSEENEMGTRSEIVCDKPSCKECKEIEEKICFG